MGDSAASLMTCEPLLMRPQWGAFGEAKKHLSVSFVTEAAIDKGIARKLGLKKPLAAVKGTRKLKKKHMLHNAACPKIEVNPETFEVRVDGELATCAPAERLPLAQRYMLR
jgi:urease subunit alpha